MNLVIDSHGTVVAIYGEEIDLASLGALTIRRASHIEPDASGLWWADLSSISGPRLGPFVRRSAALAAEQGWLEKSLLNSGFSPLSPSSPCPDKRGH